MPGADDSEEQRAKDLAQAFAAHVREMRAQQVDLDPEANRALRENIEDLYTSG